MIFPNKEGVDLNGDSFYSTYTLAGVLLYCTIS